MGLPKLTAPIFTIEMPSNKRSVKFRPFTVKEEKLLLLASESDDAKFVNDTIMQVLIVYMDFVKKNLLQQYTASLPVLSDLVNLYNIEMSLAMFIAAPCYHMEANATGVHTYSVSQQLPLIIAAQTREALDTITPEFYAAVWS